MSAITKTLRRMVPPALILLAARGAAAQKYELVLEDGQGRPLASHPFTVLPPLPDEKAKAEGPKWLFGASDDPRWNLRRPSFLEVGLGYQYPAGTDTASRQVPNYHLSLGLGSWRQPLYGQYRPNQIMILGQDKVNPLGNNSYALFENTKLSWLEVLANANLAAPVYAQGEKTEYHINGEAGLTLRGWNLAELYGRVAQSRSHYALPDLPLPFGGRHRDLTYGLAFNIPIFTAADVNGKKIAAPLNIRTYLEGHSGSFLSDNGFKPNTGFARAGATLELDLTEPDANGRRAGWAFAVDYNYGFTPGKGHGGIQRRTEFAPTLGIDWQPVANWETHQLAGTARYLGKDINWGTSVLYIDHKETDPRSENNLEVLGLSVFADAPAIGRSRVTLLQPKISPANSSGWTALPYVQVQAGLGDWASGKVGDKVLMPLNIYGQVGPQSGIGFTWDLAEAIWPRSAK